MGVAARRDDPIVILGAGLAGLSLACALIEQRTRRPIILVDRRRTWTRDRTWCTWQSGPERFDSCVTHRWASWRIRHGDREAIGSSRRYPYVHIDAELVYEAALTHLDQRPEVQLRRGESVQGVSPGPRPVVHTSAGSVEAAIVFDALGPDGLLSERSGRVDALVQRFRGWEIKTEKPIFDPAVATLMDFIAHDGPGVSFMYTLGFDPHRALIEHTSIEPCSTPRIDRDGPIAEHLGHLDPGSWEIVRHEQGELVMSRRSGGQRHGHGVFAVGTTAGAVRPSSGYAFTRIQRHCTAIAAAMRDGREIPVAPERARRQFMDAVFLSALRNVRNPERLFLALGALPGDVFARFMSDASSPTDEARVIAALPPLPMAGAALSSAGVAVGIRRGSGRRRG